MRISNTLELSLVKGSFLESLILVILDEKGLNEVISHKRSYENNVYISLETDKFLFINIQFKEGVWKLNSASHYKTSSGNEYSYKCLIDLVTVKDLRSFIRRVSVIMEKE